jgi:hypothetical protein
MEFRSYSVDPKLKHKRILGLNRKWFSLLLVSTSPLTCFFGQDSLRPKNEAVVHLPVQSDLMGQFAIFTLGEKRLAYSTNMDTLSTRNFHYRGVSKTQVNLGNVGSPVYNLVAHPDQWIGNDYTRLAHQADVPVYQGKFKQPVTYAEYQTGSAQEQLFNVFHGQTFRKGNTLLIGVDKINSKGFYRNQAVNNTHFYSRFSGMNTRQNYTYSINYTYQKQLHQLNGGLLRDADFTDNQLDFSNKSLLEVQLLNARQSLKYHKAVFNHSYTLTEDSAAHQFSLVQDIRFLQQSRLLYDTSLSADFYDYFNINENVTRDSLSYTQLGTKMGMHYSHHLSSARAITARALFFPSMNRFKNLGVDTTVLDLEATGEFQLLHDHLVAGIAGNYLLNDRYANNDYSIEGKMVFTKIARLTLGVDFSAVGTDLRWMF